MVVVRQVPEFGGALHAPYLLCPFALKNGVSAPPAPRFVWRASAKHLSYPLRWLPAPGTVKHQNRAVSVANYGIRDAPQESASCPAQTPAADYDETYRRQQREQKDLRDAGRLQSYLRTGRFMITPALP